MIYITPKLDIAYEKEDDKFNLRKLINEKNFTKSNTPLSYRQINTLSKDKLFPEDRENKKSWRKFSLKELIYFSIVFELKEFGLSHDVLRNLSDSFFKGPTPNGTLETNKYTSEIAIGCVLIQAEMMLTIAKKGKVTYYDPPHYILIGTDKSPVIQIRLNDIVNKIYKDLGKKPVPIKWSVKNYLWSKEKFKVSDSEKTVLNIIRTKKYNTIKLKTKDGNVSLVQAGKVIDTKQLSGRDVAGLIENRAYQEIEVITENGKIVSLKSEEKIKL
ncbi:MAG TPA: hypothetical protein VLG12_02505 [Candidatus Saccharimonadales bacterium]|nr:hypothetical protein [Candidatus Saccharimonadales bacterium]